MASLRSNALLDLLPVIWLYRVSGIFPINNDLTVNRKAYVFSIVIISSLFVSCVPTFSIISRIMISYFRTDNVTFMRFFGLFSSYGVTLGSGVVAVVFVACHSRDLAGVLRGMDAVDAALGPPRGRRTAVFQLVLVCTQLVLVAGSYATVRGFPPLLGVVPPFVTVTALSLTQTSLEQMQVTFFLALKLRFARVTHQLSQLAPLGPHVCRLRACHAVLELLLKRANRVFDLTLLFSLTSLFIYIVVYLFFVLDDIFDPLYTTESSFYVYVFLFVQTSFRILLLIWACGSTSSETGHYANFDLTRLVQAQGALDPLQQLMNLSPPHRHSLHQMELFSLQLMHRSSTITAYGLFVVDSTLIFTMVGAATTYLVLLLQFDNGL